MAKTTEEMDETVMGCLRLGWRVEEIWKYSHVERAESQQFATGILCAPGLGGGEFPPR